MGKLRSRDIIIFILVLIALAVVIYLVPGVTGMMVETYTAKYGELSIYDDTTGVFVRKEIVYTAEVSGSVNPLAAEGDLLRSGTTVVEITEDEASGSSPNGRISEIKDALGSNVKVSSDGRLETGGIVSFYVDGYENTLTPDRVDGITIEDFENISQADVVNLGETVTQDYPVFKIVDNSNWQFITYVPISHVDDYVPGYSVGVTFFEKDNSSDSLFNDLSSKDPLCNKVEMLILDVVEQGENAKLILRSSRYFDGIGQYRIAGARVVSQDVSGLLIENDSIIEEDGVKGVYIKNKKGKYDFVPVKIYGSNDTTSVVADTYFYDAEGEYTRTLDPFEDVLRRPESAKKGSDEE